MVISESSIINATTTIRTFFNFNAKCRNLNCVQRHFISVTIFGNLIMESNKYFIIMVTIV